MSDKPLYLSLMRHAKSSWDNAEQTDHERPLNNRGRKAAPKVGAALYAKGYAPDVIWSSDAKRTRETAMLLIREIPGAQNVLYNPDFYHASPEEVIQICDSQPAPTQNLMLLGHNPGWSQLHAYLSEHHHSFPTGACAVYKAKKALGTDWLRPENWRLVDMILPRELM